MENPGVTGTEQNESGLCQFKWLNKTYSKNMPCAKHRCMRPMDDHGNVHSCIVCGVVYLGLRNPYV